MPAKSKAQRQMMAIAKHHPSKLYKRNRRALKMSNKQLHEFAATKGLKPKRIPDVESHSYDWRKRRRNA